MSAKPAVLGMIPARGGSKRLPRKNVLPLAGAPLIAWTIDAARRAGSLTDWVFSSEDPEILEIARRYGAPVLERPAELAGDQVRNIEVLAHVLETMEGRRGAPYDMLVLLQPTCPVRDPGHIDAMVAALWESDLVTAASVKGPYKKRDPILKAIRSGVLEHWGPLQADGNIEPFYLYNASLYAARRDYFTATGRLVSDRQVPVVMDQFHSIDVDTQADFLVAEVYLKHLGKPVPPTFEEQS